MTPQSSNNKTYKSITYPKAHRIIGCLLIMLSLSSTAKTIENLNRDLPAPSYAGYKND